MARKLSFLNLLLILLALTGGTLTAQENAAKAVLQAVATNIGADDLRCLTYSGSGYVGIVGQNYTPRDDWPRVELATYTESINCRSWDRNEAAVESSKRQRGTFFASMRLSLTQLPGIRQLDGDRRSASPCASISSSTARSGSLTCPGT